MSLTASYDTQTVDIDAGGSFNIDVVGESNYLRALNRCYQDADAQPKREDGRAKIIVVELDLDDYNKHDKWAVAVRSRHGIIGHLRKEMAVIYRQKYKGKQDLKVHALISSKDPSSGIFGAWLDLPIDTNQRESVPIPSAGGRIHWDKQTKSIRERYEFSEEYDSVGKQGCAGVFILMGGVLFASIAVPAVKLFM